MKKILLSAALFLASFTTLAQVGVGTTNPDSSAALEINSITGGLLTPRLTVTQRDGISTPANGLLIFNTSNNTYEVYKSTCSCWVSILDNGNTPANSLVNTAPVASDLNYTGTFRVDGTAIINYKYADSQGDNEGATGIQWEVANDNLGEGKSNLGTASSQPLGSSEAGRYIRASVTPRAAAGILNGITYYGDWTLVDAAAVPYATAVSVSGTIAQGSELIGTYVFNGGSGTEYVNPNDANDKSLYNWQIATDASGTELSNALLPDGQEFFYDNFTPNSAHIGKYIRVGVKAKDSNSLSATSFVYSSFVGPIEVAVESAPVVNNITFSPSPGANVTLTGSYTYSDANNDPEGTSTYQWYTADDANGLNQTPIAGATGISFTVTPSGQDNKYIGFGVTPVAQTGTTSGSEVVYFNPEPSKQGATFTFDSEIMVSNNFHNGRVMDSSNFLIVQIDVSSAGSISFTSTSPTSHGYNFSGGGTYEVGDNQQVVLQATGTKSSYNSSGDDFTIEGLGINPTALTLSVNINNVKLGADFTAHYNGISNGEHSAPDHELSSYSGGETFNNNSAAISSIISASPCTSATITVGANTYNTVEVNGQCWMGENLKELPNGIAVDSDQWKATTPGDLGYYGYYDINDTSGASGWDTVEPVAGEGLLYQWSAAMNGSTTERAQGICPTGWHIPSDAEWMYLEHGLGMAISEQTLTAWRANNDDNQGTPGYKLRSAGGGQTNASGFSGVLPGYRNTGGVFLSRLNGGFWWSSSVTTSSAAYVRHIAGNNRGVFRFSYNKANAFSVRCLQD